jgi:hypothetical protein
VPELPVADLYPIDGELAHRPLEGPGARQRRVRHDLRRGLPDHVVGHHRHPGAGHGRGGPEREHRNGER